MKLQFKNIWRNIRKNKGYSLLNITGLSIGIASAGMIFLWTIDETNFDSFHSNYNHVYAVRVTKAFDGHTFTMGSTPRPMAAALKKEIPGIAIAARMSDQPIRALLSTNDHAIYLSGRQADAEIFQMFDIRFLEGNPKEPFPTMHSLLISRGAAEKIFGQSKQLTGRRITMDNNEEFTIAGVFEDMPPNSSIQFDWLASYQLNLRNRDGQSWNSYGPFTYLMLQPGADEMKIQGQLKNFIPSHDEKENSEAQLFAMKYWHLYDDFANGKMTGKGKISQIRLFTAIGWIIILIACINFINLSIAGGQQRLHEVSVRKILGAARIRLIGFFFGEAMVLATVAGILAVAIIFLLLPEFNSLMQKSIRFPDSAVHLFSVAGLTIFCGIAAGIYPAIYLSSFKPVQSLRTNKLKTSAAAWVRKSLVVIQFSIAIIFIIGTITIYQQIQFTKERNLGFEKDRLVEINLHRNIVPDFNLIKQELLQSGSIENAAWANHITLKGGNTDDRFRWQGKAPSGQISIAFRYVSPEYMDVSGMKVIQGNNFDLSGIADDSHVIITESFAKIIGEDQIIGKIIQSPRGLDSGFKNFTIKGVINDYVYGNVYGNPGPALFFSSREQKAEYLYLRIKKNADLSNSISQIESIVRKHNPAFPFEYSFVDEQFDHLFRNEEMIRKMTSIFGSLAIIISCLGLFGLAAFSTSRRIKEISIRKVLGAKIMGVVALMSSEFLFLVLISCLIAVPVAWMIVNQWLQNFYYRMPVPWWAFFLATGLALCIAFATISFRVIRTALVNPVQSLKTE